MVWAPSSWIGARGIVLKLRMHFFYIRRHPFLAFNIPILRIHGKVRWYLLHPPEYLTQPEVYDKFPERWTSGVQSKWFVQPEIGRFRSMVTAPTPSRKGRGGRCGAPRTFVDRKGHAAESGRAAASSARPSAGERGGRDGRVARDGRQEQRWGARQ